MITLHSGLPGHGKTLFEIVAIKKMAAANPGRPVFYSGIRDLRLPWTNIGGYLKNDQTGVFDEVIPDTAPVKGGREWFKLPEGSILMIDECHNYFPPRGQGQPVPQWVMEFATHRHRGFDIILLTQHPGLIDVAVRRLVERHYHSMRWFGCQIATVHEFMGVKDQIEKSRKGSIEHKFVFPKDAYSWYKSAELHTVKSRIPLRFWFLFVAPLLLVALGYLLYQRMSGYVTRAGAEQRIQGKVADGGDKTAGGSSSAAAAAAAAKVLTPAQYASAFVPRIKGLPHTAPMFDEPMKVVSAPTPVACVESVKRCACYTDQGTAVDVSASICSEIVARGFFQYWARSQAQNSVAVAPVAVKADVDKPYVPLIARNDVGAPVEDDHVRQVRAPLDPKLRAPNFP